MNFTCLIEGGVGGRKWRDRVGLSTAQLRAHVTLAQSAPSGTIGALGFAEFHSLVCISILQ
jgi:hypothetical protein